MLFRNNKINLLITCLENLYVLNRFLSFYQTLFHNSVYNTNICILLNNP